MVTKEREDLREILFFSECVLSYYGSILYDVHMTFTAITMVRLEDAFHWLAPTRHFTTQTFTTRHSTVPMRAFKPPFHLKH